VFSSIEKIIYNIFFSFFIYRALFEAVWLIAKKTVWTYSPSPNTNTFNHRYPSTGVNRPANSNNNITNKVNNKANKVNRAKVRVVVAVVVVAATIKDPVKPHFQLACSEL
jgi:hypothetical protein